MRRLYYSNGKAPAAVGGRLMITYWSGALQLWAVVTGAQVRRLQEDMYGTWTMAFSPDGRLLAAGTTDGRMEVWEIHP